MKKICLKFDKVGLTDRWFEKYCLNINMFKWLLKRVEKQEEKSKNNKKRKKIIISKSDKKKVEKSKVKSVRLSA
jgi:hypothetical protein